jgi:uncharacterized protein (TIGR03083 family)
MDPADLVAGYPVAATTLIDALSAAGPDGPAWTFGPEPKAGFWQRRQVHETLVHLYDAMLANGSAALWDPEPELAWDGVDEVATLFYPRQVRLDRTQALTRPLRLTATDLDRSLTLGEGDDPLELALPAADLLLALWKREPVADTDAASLLAAAVTP